ncbi:MAG: YIEGIA domain-containing protein [Bacillota bacterium]
MAEQFRSIRGMERDSLKALEDNELVPRGTEYIENIARVFETRYYIVIVVAAATALGVLAAVSAHGGRLGRRGLHVGRRPHSGRDHRRDGRVWRAAPVAVRGSDVWVGDILIFSVGLKESQEFIREMGSRGHPHAED